MITTIRLVNNKEYRYIKNSPEKYGWYHVWTDMFTIGRNDDNDMQIHDEEDLVSRMHCAIIDKRFLRDLGSTNGTKVNGKSISKKDYTLKHLDIITIGNTKLLY